MCTVADPQPQSTATTATATATATTSTKMSAADPAASADFSASSSSNSIMLDLPNPAMATVMTSWEQLKQSNPDDIGPLVGKLVFGKFFQLAPQALDLFPFDGDETAANGGSSSGIDETTGLVLFQNKSWAFQLHSKRVVETFDMVIDGLMDLERETLVELGERHISFLAKGNEDVNLPQFFGALGEALLYALQVGMGESWNATLQEAWTLVITFIATSMTEGMHRGMAKRNSKTNSVPSLQKSKTLDSTETTATSVDSSSSSSATSFPDKLKEAFQIRDEIRVVASWQQLKKRSRRSQFHKVLLRRYKSLLQEEEQKRGQEQPRKKTFFLSSRGGGGKLPLHITEWMEELTDRLLATDTTTNCIESSYGRSVEMQYLFQAFLETGRKHLAASHGVESKALLLGTSDYLILFAQAFLLALEEKLRHVVSLSCAPPEPLVWDAELEQSWRRMLRIVVHQVVDQHDDNNGSLDNKSE